MKAKADQSRQATARNHTEKTLRTRLEAMELELAQKDLLLSEGFEVFTQTAEKLQHSHKRLQQTVNSLNVELDGKNKELERNLLEKEKVKTYLSNIFESLAVGVLVTDLDGNVTSINRAGLHMLGAGAVTLVGEHVNDVLQTSLLPDIAPAPGSPGVSREEPVTFTRPDGETLILEVSISRMTGEGNPLGYIFNVQDVTLLKRLEEHAARRNRLTAMGEMAANMAHEIRNPLGSIELFASLVQKGLTPEDEKHGLMNHIFSAVGSMDHIISNLLQYTKPRAVSLQKLDLHDLLGEVIEFSRHLAGQSGVNMRVKLEAKRCGVQGDPELLKQVFHNLILNAVQAMLEGGTLTVTTRTQTLTDPKVLARFGELRGRSGRLEVLEARFQDTGVGMSKEVRNQIFDPFFTTKSRGTGLGLSIVNSIMESHHALIDVENRAHQGTAMILMFPLPAG